LLVQHQRVDIQIERGAGADAAADPQDSRTNNEAQRYACACSGGREDRAENKADNGQTREHSARYSEAPCLCPLTLNPCAEKFCIAANRFHVRYG